MEDAVYVLDAELVDHEGVACTSAARKSETLEPLHGALRRQGCHASACALGLLVKSN